MGVNDVIVGSWTAVEYALTSHARNDTFQSLYALEVDSTDTTTYK